MAKGWASSAILVLGFVLHSFAAQAQVAVGVHGVHVGASASAVAGASGLSADASASSRLSSLPVGLTGGLLSSPLVAAPAIAEFVSPTPSVRMAAPSAASPVIAPPADFTLPAAAANLFPAAKSQDAALPESAIVGRGAATAANGSKDAVAADVLSKPALSARSDEGARAAGDALFDASRRHLQEELIPASKITATSRSVRGQPAWRTPKYLYHFTTVAAWEAIQRSGYLRPAARPHDPVPAIFAVERKNFLKNWVDSREIRLPGLHRVLEKNGVEMILERMMGKLLTLLDKRRFRAAAKGAVVLRIQVESRTDQIKVRDNRLLFQDSRRRRWDEFWTTQKSLAVMTRKESRDGMMEFLIMNRVPLQRVTALEPVPFSLLPKSPRAMKRSFPPGRIFELFFGSEGPVSK